MLADFEALCSLVHASPVFREQYLLDRRTILSTVFETMLGNVTVEACARYQGYLFGSASWTYPQIDEKLELFLETWKARTSPCDYSMSVEQFDGDDVAAMTLFHQKFVKPFVRGYTSWALANLNKHLGTEIQHKPLTQTEETRIMRALYRYQLCCHMWGRADGDLGRQHWGSDKANLYVEDMLDSIEPWEVEELICVYAFVKAKLDETFTTIQDDVHPDNPEFDHQRRLSSPDGAFVLDDKGKISSLRNNSMYTQLELTSSGIRSRAS